MQHFSIGPASYQYISQLINAFHEVHPDMAKAFMQNPKIRSRITWSLNEQDWTNKFLSVRHLVKSIYRACPTVWFKMLNRITANFGGIDLESLYAEVSETAVGRQPPDPE